MSAQSDDTLWEYECQLARKVVASNLRTDQALRDIKIQAANELKFRSASALRRRQDASASQAKFAGMCINLDEVRIGRVVDDLLETYRRLSRPEKVGRQWSLPKWCLVATTLSKLRCLANVALWYLPPPANNTSRDPKALCETGISDAGAAAAHIEAMEGEMDARILRVAARLVALGESSSEVSKLRLSSETHTMARLTLMNLRNTASKVEQLMSEAETRSVVMQHLEESYGALAASLSSLRQRLSQDTGQRLQALQEPLMDASSAARSLGVGRLSQGKDSKERTSVARDAARGDPFKPLHQATLLTNIASLTEVQTPREENMASDQVLALLASEPASTSSREDTQSQGKDDAAWNIEFTTEQLRQMQQAISAKEPKIHGAQTLLHETLECYTKLANAMGMAYCSEKTMRANPAQLASHRELLKLVRDLRGLWQDSGVLLVPSRATDLLALEKVRCRHDKLVLNVLQKAGLQAATVVLARLALVDEMLQEPGTRILTGEVSFELIKPYQLLESTVRSLATSADERRRRRWLRCPHASLYSVLAGEMWHQLLERFVTVEAAFEPLLPCEDIPLSFREFRIALSLLEVNVSERLAVFLFEAAADTSSSGEATTKGLHDIVTRYGATASGDRGMSASVAAAAARSLNRGNDSSYLRWRTGSKALARAETPSSIGDEATQSRIGISRRGHSKQKSKRGSMAALFAEGGTTDAEIDLSECLPAGAPFCCRRCINGDALMLPYLSVQELNRTCCMASRGSDAPQVSAGERNGMTPEVHSGEKAFSSPEEQKRFGEDTIISWSSAFLTQSILLTQDERGIYFKWLAKIVLFGLATNTAEATLAKDGALARENSRNGIGSNPRSIGRRNSFCREGSVQGRRSSFSMSGPEVSQGRHSIVNSSTPEMHVRRSIVPSALRSPGDEAAFQARIAAEAKAKAEAEFERSEYEEALREISVALPETVLNVIRVDMGLQALAFTSKAQSQARMAPRTSMTASLYSDFTDVLAKGGPSMAQRAKRAAREAKLFVNLRHLNVLESDLSTLQRELSTVAEHAPPNVNGILLVAGAARAAQGILARKTMTTPRTEPDVKDSTKDSNEKATCVAAGMRATHALQAQKVIESSSIHAQHCYERCGYESGSQEVAAALRFLEHELFKRSRTITDSSLVVAPADAATTFLKVGEDHRETVTLLAPLLLPKGTANKLLDQAQREEEEDLRRQAAEAKSASTNDQKPRLQIQPIVRVKSIDFQPSVSSRGTSPNAEPTSPQSLNSGSSGSPRPRSQRDSHLSHASRRVSNSCESQPRHSRRSSRNPELGSRGSMGEDLCEGSSTRGGRFPSINTTPWLTPTLTTDDESATWQGHSSDWPPEVLRLFSSVQDGCQRMRSAVTESNSFRKQKHQRFLAQLIGAKVKAADCMVKSASAPTLLPRVTRPSSDVGNEKRYKRVAAACRTVPLKGWSSRELSDNGRKPAMATTF